MKKTKNEKKVINNQITITKELCDAFIILSNVYRIGMISDDRIYNLVVGHSGKDGMSNVSNLIELVADIQHENGWCEEKDCPYVKKQ